MMHHIPFGAPSLPQPGVVPEFASFDLGPNFSDPPLLLQNRNLNCYIKSMTVSDLKKSGCSFHYSVLFFCLNGWLTVIRPSLFTSPGCPSQAGDPLRASQSAHQLVGPLVQSSGLGSHQPRSAGSKW